VLTAAILAAALPAPASEATVRGVASSHFTGSSTLHDFSGSSPQTSFRVEPASDGSWSAVVEVPVDSLTTANASRDRKMREMFRATEHPMLRAQLPRIVPDEVRTSGRLPLRLTITGRSNDVVASVRDWHQTDDRVDFVAEFDVSLAAFGLEAPRAFVIVVADSVHVTTDVSLRRE
jgi:polyisoprenoid-binding protein YceI